MESKLNLQDALDYIMAGNALFTVKNIETNNRFTFKVEKSKKADYMFYVSVLTGPNNTDNYTYIGAIINSVFKLTKASEVTTGATSFKVFNYIFYHLKLLSLPANIHVFHHGRCGRCGDVLTVPESIQRGLGPVCAKLIDKKKKASNLLFK